MSLSGKSRLAGVAGWPVSHSRSPALHGHWLRRYRIDGAYVPLPVAPENFERALRALPLLGFRGCNVTVPHKEAALRLVDRASEEARRIGAVNTIVVEADGTLTGSNTDGYGFLENLTGAAPSWRADRGPAVMIGAGGAARAVLVALLDAGAPEVRVTNRSREKAEALADAFGDRVAVVDWSEREAALGLAALVVNTTSLGMTGQPPLELRLDDLPGDALVTDIVYAPLETALLAEARRRGNPVVDGLGMLLHQARPGFEAWFGVPPTVDGALRAAVLSA